MSDFKQRLIDEKQELDNKAARLSGFIDSDKIKEIDTLQFSLLIVQLQAMKTYSTILNERLKWM